MINLTVLGSGSAVQFQNRASASYLIDFGTKKLLLDAGFWILSRLEQISVSIDKIDYIFISHKHPDHFLGLIHLLFALKNPIYKRNFPITIFGFYGLKDYFLKFKNILGAWIEPDVDLIFIEEKRKIFKEFSYKLFKTKHTEESVGINLKINNKKIVYTSDTEFFKELIEITDGADIVIFECATKDENKSAGHLSYKDILYITEKTNIKKTILSHFYPESLPRVKLPDNFILADDLFSIKIN